MIAYCSSPWCLHESMVVYGACSSYSPSFEAVPDWQRIRCCSGRKNASSKHDSPVTLRPPKLDAISGSIPYVAAYRISLCTPLLGLERCLSGADNEHNVNSRTLLCIAHRTRRRSRSQTWSGSSDQTNTFQLP